MGQHEACASLKQMLQSDVVGSRLGCQKLGGKNRRTFADIALNLPHQSN